MADYPTAQGLMSGPLGGWLQGQIAVREEAKAKARRRVGIGAAILVPLALLMFALLDADVDDKMMLAFGAGALAYGWSRLPIIAAKKTVKAGINAAVAEALGLTYRIDCEEGEEFTRADRFRMFPSWDKAAFEDRWEGAVQGFPFSLHEAHLKEWQGSGKSRRLVTVFRGSIISIGFAQTFHGVTLVTREGKHDRLFFGKRDQVELDGLLLDAAPMVHPDFEDVFDVFTTDQVEARWIVHPVYIEKLIAIEDAFKGENIAALFAGGAVVIVLACGNLFESGSIDPGEDERKLDDTIDQFQRLADLALALNTVRH